MTAATSQEPVATIDRRDGEQIRVAWSEYRGVRFLDVRIYYKTSSGIWQPTKKGITVLPDQLDELEAALAKAKRSAPR